MIILANVILAGVQLGITILRSTDGPALASNYQQIEQLKLNNWRLIQTISQKSTLAFLETKAGDLGLIKLSPTFVNLKAKVASLVIQ